MTDLVKRTAELLEKRYKGRVSISVEMLAELHDEVVRLRTALGAAKADAHDARTVLATHSRNG